MSERGVTPLTPDERQSAIIVRHFRGRAETLDWTGKDIPAVKVPMCVYGVKNLLADRDLAGKYFLTIARLTGTIYYNKTYMYVHLCMYGKLRMYAYIYSMYI